MTRHCDTARLRQRQCGNFAAAPRHRLGTGGTSPSFHNGPAGKPVPVEPVNSECLEGRSHGPLFCRPGTARLIKTFSPADAAQLFGRRIMTTLKTLTMV